MTVPEKWLHLDLTLTYEQIRTCPQLLREDTVTESTFPAEGHGEWTAVRLTLDDVLLPLVARRRYAFASDPLYLNVRVGPQSLLISESLRYMGDGQVHKLPMACAVEYGSLEVQIVVWGPVARFPGAARVRFEARLAS